MAKDIKLLVGGSIERAEKALRELQRTGGDVAHRLERDFQSLGTSSSLAFDQKRQAATEAYERIKRSGIGTADELKRAEKAHAAEMIRIDEEQYGKRLSFAEKYKAGALAAVAAVAAAAYAAYNIGKAAVEEAAEFETALVDLGKVTGESLDDVREKIMALPPELGSATDLVKGYYQVISAGVTDPLRAMNLLKQAAKASKAAHIDQGETIKAVTKMMAGFSGEIKNATEATDLLFAIEKVGQTSFAELAPIIGDIASISHQAAVSQYEMGAMMSQLTQTAGSTSQAATQYKAVLMGLIKPQKTMQEALDAMGYSSGQAAVESRGLSGTLRGLQEWAEKSGVGMSKLFESSEALTGLGPQLADQFSGYASSLQQMEQSAGGTDQAFKDWSGTFAAVKETFDNTLNKTLIDLGQQLMPIVIEKMKEVSAWVSENRDQLVEVFRGMADAIQWTITKAEQLARVLKPVASIIGTGIQNSTGFKGLQAAGSFLGMTEGSDASGPTRYPIPDRPSVNADPNAPFGSYATGTSYVPATGLYQLHRGEQVVSRGDVAGQKQGPAPIQISGGINVTVQGGNETPATAREIARQVYPELRRLALRYN